MILAVDVDPRALLWFRHRVRRFPLTRMHQTPRGGWHLVYRLPLPPAPLLGSSAGRLAPGLDTHGEGSYVIWPPSPGYEVVVHPQTEIVPLPAWILRRLTMAPKAPAASRVCQPRPAAARGTGEFRRALASGRAGSALIMGGVAGARGGRSREDRRARGDGRDHPRGAASWIGRVRGGRSRHGRHTAWPNELNV